MPILLRAGVRVGVAGMILLGVNSSLQNAIAEGDTRTLSFHHLHTGEGITITFKRNGRYDEAALKKLDWFMRDWRKEESIHMDPHLFDILWETYREVGATQPIQIVCGYRSPKTNAMLRARSSGVAEFSQHMLGHAMDFFIPGVPLEKVREVGLRLQRGGVGFYPTSGSPFVHMDTGSIRHWPRMTYAQLSKVFPDGRTVHVAADGRPLPGYVRALAEVERRGNTPNANSLVAARAAGVITASQEQRAATVAQTSIEQTNAQQPKRTLLANLFSFMRPKNTNEAEGEKSASAPVPKNARTTVASLTPREAKRVASERIVPLPAARPHIAVAAVAPQHPKQTFVTASAAGSIFENNGLRTHTGKGDSSASAPNSSKSPFEIATAELDITGSTDEALSYAATPSRTAATPTRPLGNAVPRLAQEARLMPVSGNTTMAVKPPLAPAMATGGQSLDSPWLRAAILAPSVSGFMTTTPLGHMDTRSLRTLLDKPSQSVTMTFSADPALGMLADRFTSPAVVFLATTTFTRQTTASLQ